MRAAVLTVSDGVVAGTRDDRSGEVLAASAAATGFDVVERRAVADERPGSCAALRELCAAADLVLTTGGTGFAPRDVTPEATAEVVERPTPGLDEAMREVSRRASPHGLLSRRLQRHRRAHPGRQPAGQPARLRGVLRRDRRRAPAWRGAAARPADGASMSATTVYARRFVSLVKFEHTVFALPFAYVGMILAVGGAPSFSLVFWITVAMVGARSLAMALNRLIDHEIDARNPRTAGRELPRGLLSPGQVAVFAVAGAGRVPDRRLAARPDRPLAVADPGGGVRPLPVHEAVHLDVPLRPGRLDRPLAACGMACRGQPRCALAPVLISVAVALWVGGFDVLYGTAGHRDRPRPGAAVDPLAGSGSRAR